MRVHDDLNKLFVSLLRGQVKVSDLTGYNIFWSLDHEGSETFDRIQKSSTVAEKWHIKVDHYARIFGSLYRKIPQKWNLEKIRYPLFSALGAPNIPIFGLETDIRDIYKIKWGILEILIFWQNMAILGVKNSQDPDFGLFFGLKMAIFCLKSKISKIPHLIS